MRTRPFITKLLLSFIAASALIRLGSAFGDTQHFRHTDSKGVVTLSDTPVINGQITRQSYRNLTRTPVVARLCNGLSNQQVIDRGQALDTEFIAIAQRVSVSPALLKAVARAESCFDPYATSSAGAQGLMQLMPATANALGVQNSMNAQQNLLGGARYLAQMLKRYSSNIDLALAAYNAGPGTVDKYSGIPPYRETQRYIATVKRFQKQFALSMPTRSRHATGS